MPLIRRAELKIVVANDLKGLGATEGPALAYLWTPASPWPALIPWVALLALLLLPINRSPQAWVVVVPLALASAASSALLPGLLGAAVPQEVLPILKTIVSSFAFGLGAVWLLGPYLQHRLRFVAFLKVLVACAGMSVFAYWARSGWSPSVEVLGYSVLLGVLVFIAVAAFVLAGCLCRRRYRPAALALWSAVFLAAIPLAIALPFFVLGTRMSGGAPPWREFLVGILGPPAACYAVLLLFLLLSFLNPFYRQRLTALLHLESTPAPPTISPIEAPPLQPVERS